MPIFCDDEIYHEAYYDSDYDTSRIEVYLHPPPFSIPENEREIAARPRKRRPDDSISQRATALDGRLGRRERASSRYWEARYTKLGRRAALDEMREEVKTQLAEWRRLIELHSTYYKDSLEGEMWERHVVWQARLVSRLYYLHYVPQ